MERVLGRQFFTPIDNKLSPFGAILANSQEVLTASAASSCKIHRCCSNYLRTCRLPQGNSGVFINLQSGIAADASRSCSGCQSKAQLVEPRRCRCHSSQLAARASSRAGRAFRLHSSSTDSRSSGRSRVWSYSAPRGHALGSSGEGRYCASRRGRPRLPSASPPEARRYPDCCDC